MRPLSIQEHSVAALQLRVEDLAAEHLIAVDYRVNGTPRTDARNRRVVVAPDEDAASYFDALERIAVVVAGPNAARTLAIQWASDNTGCCT